ncbi:MAG: DNA mismatch repair endonuclease MutL [Schwartzia sp.]|nr:DNA mismatch repair endonuclease MutL [Schwartzia sp. (in: firmicutes)]
MKPDVNKITVQVLDDTTINKIAAGEVVERPASVVKELAENAIDAGATRIEIETMAGGTSFIRVTDDGCGMSPENARLAIMRHATSKIRSVEDLLTIGTMGFRGEALPTIASVSRFSLKTRRHADQLGTAIEIVGGRDTDISETGCAPGTTIKVEDLFFNTPARKKFLKTPHTEGQKISDAITKLALANPGISFKYISNNRPVINTPGSDDMVETIRALYGQQAAESLLRLNFSDTDVTIGGYVSKPSMLRSSRGWQTFFVNGRIISSKALAKALDNAYRSLVPNSGYPLAVLDIRVNPRSVDVNVHPQKAEVKFEDEGRLFRTVYKAIVDAIRPAGQNLNQVAASIEHVERRYVTGGADYEQEAAPAPAGNLSGYSQGRLTFGMERPTVTEADLDSFREARDIIQGDNGQVHLSDDYRNELRKEMSADDAPADTVDYGAVSYGGSEDRSFAAESGKARPLLPGHDPLAGDKVPEALGQIARCYIVARDDTGLFIVDQHAAHERILYDRLCAMSENIPSQGLVIHQILDFPPVESRLITDEQELLNRFGFYLEPCGEYQFRLTAVPADIPVSEAVDTIRQILMSVTEQKDVTTANLRHHCLATTACHSAIRQGDELTVKQMQLLIEELARTNRPYTCPHGRPTILRFDRDALALMFKRT